MPENIRILYSYALKILSGKEIPEKLVQEKIQKKYKESSFEDISVILEILKKEKFIDDNRYCDNFIYWRKENMPRGKNMIVQELIQKKISVSLAQEKCEELISYTDEYNMCIKLAEIKFLRLSNIEDIYKKKEKLFRFLAGKMFSFSIINDVWESVSKE